MMPYDGDFLILYPDRYYDIIYDIISMIFMMIYDLYSYFIHRDKTWLTWLSDDNNLCPEIRGKHGKIMGKYTF